ncbi:unnamed protein product [Prunus armeniaca]|uniref:Uncharacterized protein n=1 Tax=Prunus armeniaca TaxID=36596 RepID=A0A6J5WTP2_PRUAR|nr:unnamed protein product [Prunus armeniaca]
MRLGREILLLRILRLVLSLRTLGKLDFGIIVVIWLVQDDVHGLFSFNVDVAFSSADFRGANVVLHDPEPLDIGQMELNEGESHLVTSGASNEDEHDLVGDAVGLAGMLIDFDVRRC